MKRVFSLLLILLLLSLLCTTAFAEGESLGYVTDQAGILTAEQEQELADYAAELSRRYGVAVYIVTVQDYREYNASSVVSCAEEIYTYYDLGYGADRDGILLLLSMDDRDYSLTTFGYYADYCFGDRNKDYVESAFLAKFRNNDWFGGFQEYLNVCDDVLGTAAAHQLSKNSEPCTYSGQTYSRNSYRYGELIEKEQGRKMSTGLKLLIGIGAPCLIALIVCSTFKAQMKTAKLRTTAEEYVVPGSATLRVSDDRFINRTETRVPIPRNTGSSGRSGGGGSSGGFHSHSGKF